MAEEVKDKSKDKKKVDVHIMHSMKGGCGKSTCALFKTLQIAQERGIEDRRAHVLFLDADFKGSAMIQILFRRMMPSAAGVKALPSAKEESSTPSEGGTSVDEREMMRKLLDSGKEVEKGDGIHHQIAMPLNFGNNKTVSDYLRDSARCSIKDVIWHSCSHYVEEIKKTAPTDTDDTTADAGQGDYINGYVDFILSSMSADSKNWFRHRQGRIAAGVYSCRMETLLRNILKEGAVNTEKRGTYSDIVIDMPPGYDEYSDILMDILRRIAEESENIRLHYYAVTTADIGHRELAKNIVGELTQDCTDHKPFSSVNLVLSAVSQEDFSALSDADKKDYKRWLQDGTPGKVYINEYARSYHKFCREGTEGKFEQDVRSALKDIDEWEPKNETEDRVI